MINKKIRAAFNAGLSRDEYDRLRPIVAQQNLKTLQWVSLLTSVLMLALAASASFPFFSLLEANRCAYLIMGASSIAVYGAALLLPGHPSLAKPLFYFFLALVVAFSVFIGVYTNTAQRASTICVLLLAIPLLVTDKPWRISILLSLSVLFFCAASHHYKDHALFVSDLVNCLCMFVVGVAVNFAQQSMKYQNINDRYIIDQYNIQLIHTQEAKLEESRIAIMLSQIQPHFLYNSLSAISYLCEQDPLAAQAAINDFADYLRGNLDSLKLTVPVPFDKELEHIRIYLSLEKLRFGDELELKYDIAATGFLVPALTVQPLVENAVRYGVLGREGGGVVTIATREYPDRFEITVSDNGVGYDTQAAQTDGRTHVGVENVRSRLAAMVGGSLEIQSTRGVGTTAAIKLPKERTQ